jgi:hypothetical protein
MHIILVGASHGWRLFRALKRIQGYGTIFKVTCLCVSGAKFVDLVWPKTVNKDDFLVVIPFGNDLHIRKYVKLDRYLKVFHLEKFVPYPKEHWTFCFQNCMKNCRIKIVKSS